MPEKEYHQLEEIKNKSERKYITMLLRGRTELKEQVEALEAKKKQLKEELSAWLDLNSIKQIQYNHYVVSKKNGRSSFLSKELLLENGVSPKIIAESTTSKEWTSVEVRDLTKRRKDGEDE